MDDTYTKLVDLMNENPELVFQNDGYQELPKAVVDEHREEIEQIESLLGSCITGFVRFQNFKPRKDGSVAVRYQVRYSDFFTGVAYTPLDDFK